MARTFLVYLPNIKRSRVSSTVRATRMRGSGGSVLISKGGPGVGSSYDGVDDYVATTGRNPMSGTGNLGKKLESLSLSLKPKPTKLKNIKFNL